MEELEEWEEELEKGFLKVTEGPHELVVKSPPIKRTNNYGKDQWLFEDAELDGKEGKITPPKGLLHLVKKVRQEQLAEGGARYPVRLKFTRHGMSIDSEFRMQSKIDDE